MCDNTVNCLVIYSELFCCVIERSWVQNPAVPLTCNNYGHVVQFTHMCLCYGVTKQYNLVLAKGNNAVWLAK